MEDKSVANQYRIKTLSVALSCRQMQALIFFVFDMLPDWLPDRQIDAWKQYRHRDSFKAYRLSIS